VRVVSSSVETLARVTDDLGKIGTESVYLRTVPSAMATPCEDIAVFLYVGHRLGC
jgi:hypothetical protein